MDEIWAAGRDDIEKLDILLAQDNQKREERYFETCLDLQDQKLREVLLIIHNGEICGFCHYNRNSKYQPFRSLKIPEIQDIYISKDCRRNGLATSMIEYCENKAREEGHDLIGLGVGLYADYGKAQKLYAKLGYQPDGCGIVYDRVAIEPGKSYSVDDDLCLMMIKELKPAA